MAIKLGASYRDKITGFTGVATGYVQYLTGCSQGLIQPAVKADGSLPESHWFDEQRLDPVGGTVITLNNAETPGPDLPAPKH